MRKSITTLGGAVAVLLWFTGPAWAPRDCPTCVGTKPGGKVSNPNDKTFKGVGTGNEKWLKGGSNPMGGTQSLPAGQKSQKVK